MMDDISLLEENVAREPYNRSSYVLLIDKLMSGTSNNPNLGELAVIREKLETYRTTFANQFNTDLSFWQTWLLDYTIERSPKEVLALYEDVAFELFPHSELVADYIDYCNRLLEEEKINEDKYRQALEKALALCGGDVAAGAVIWKRLRDFEVDEHEDVLEISTSAAEIRASKQRIVSAFHRQLATPLAGNDRALLEFESILEELFVEGDMEIVKPQKLKETYDKSSDDLKARLVYEEHLLSSEFDTAGTNERYQTWRTYIAFEISDQQLYRAQRLYERAAMDISDCKELWLDFANFAANVVKNWKLCASVTKRALRTCYSDIELWITRFVSLEQCQMEDALAEAVALALQSGLTDANDYLTVLLYSIDARRRRLQNLLSTNLADLSDSILSQIQSNIQSLHATFEYAESFIASYYDVWTAGWLTLVRHEAYTEEALAKQIDSSSISVALAGVELQGKEIWERAVKRAPLASAWLFWQEYLRWSRANRSIEVTRKLYKRAVAAVGDYSEDASREWLLFEQQAGTLSDYYAAWSRCRAIAVKRKEADIAAAAAAADAANAKASKSTKKRSLPGQNDDNTNDRSSNKSNSKFGGNHNDNDNDEGSKHLDKRVRFIENTTLTEDNHSEGAMDLEASQSTPQLVATDGNGNSNSKVVLVSNINFKLPLKAIQSHFEQCGPIAKAELVLSKSGTSRGIAHIEFESVDGANKALLLNNTEFSGRPLRVELITSFTSENQCNDSGISSSSSNNNSVADAINNDRSTTVFVSRFGKSITEDNLREMFAACGVVVAVKLNVDKSTKESKCSALVQFESVEGQAAALSLHKTLTDHEDQLLSIVPSKFPIIPATATAQATSSATVAESKVVVDEPPSVEDNLENAYLTTSGTVQRKARMNLNPEPSNSKSKFAFKPRALGAKMK